MSALHPFTVSKRERPQNEKERLQVISSGRNQRPIDKHRDNSKDKFKVKRKNDLELLTAGI
jgi:hypothetical protein